MKDKRKHPRWFQHLRAILGAYFWLPCPICGENFGGHEWSGNLYQGHGRGVGVCANCADEARKLSKEVMKRDPIPAVVFYK